VDRLVPGTVLAFAGGIAAARCLPPAAAGAILLGLALGTFAAYRIPVLRRRFPLPFGTRATPALLVLAALLGVARAGVDGLPPGPRDLDRLLPRDPLPVVVEGIAATAPGRISRPAPGGREEPVVVHAFGMEVDTLLGPGGPVGAEGRVEVFVEGAPPPLLPGDRLRVAGIARSSQGERNPGGPDRAASARDRGEERTLDAPGPGAIEVLAPGGPSPARAAALLQGALLRAVGAAYGGEGRALYEALLAGRKEDLDPEVSRDFRRTGTYHILVVSGIHVAFAAAAAAWLLGRAGAGIRAQAAGTILAAATYAAASGFGVPSRRALVAVALVALGPMLRRRSDPLHSLFVAAGLILAVRPEVLEEAGFQLSFGAVLGILRFARPIGDLLFARRRFLMRFPIPAADRSLRRRLGDFIERALPTALAAWAATAPLLAYHFGTVSPVTPLANLVVVPAATAALAMGAVLLPVGLVLPGVSAPLGDGAAAVLAAAVRFFAGLPGAWIAVPPPPAWILGADAAVLALAAVRPTGMRLLGMALGMAALVVGPLAFPPRPPVPSVLALDTGHGLSVLCDSGRTRVLYDAGGRGPRVGEDVILPALRARGAGALEALVISHEDVDHLSAVREVLENVPVGVLVVGEGFGVAPPAKEILAAADRAGVPVRRSAAGDVLSWPGLRMEVLHPPRGLSPRPSDNDGSLAVRVSMEGLAALMTGDLETRGVQALLLAGADLRADVLVLPHHGSPLVEGVPALAAACRASYLVSSAGSGTVRVDRVASPFAPRFLCTAEEGAVLVTAR
jgi:competence protein ComEC